MDATLRRRIPCNNKTLVALAALRLQYLYGDQREEASFPENGVTVHPMQEDGLFTPLDHSVGAGA